MTLAELTKMRKLRARPAFPVILTDDEQVHLFCAQNDLPVLWIPGLPPSPDFAPLHGLDVWLVTADHRQDRAERIREHSPASLWIVGFHGLAAGINNTLGREAMWRS